MVHQSTCQMIRPQTLLFTTHNVACVSCLQAATLGIHRCYIFGSSLGLYVLVVSLSVNNKLHTFTRIPSLSYHSVGQGAVVFVWEPQNLL